MGSVLSRVVVMCFEVLNGWVGEWVEVGAKRQNNGRVNGVLVNGGMCVCVCVVNERQRVRVRVWDWSESESEKNEKERGKYITKDKEVEYHTHTDCGHTRHGWVLLYVMWVMWVMKGLYSFNHLFSIHLCFSASWLPCSHTPTLPHSHPIYFPHPLPSCVCCLVQVDIWLSLLYACVPVCLYACVLVCLCMCVCSVCMCMCMYVYVCVCEHVAWILSRTHHRWKTHTHTLASGSSFVLDPKATKHKYGKKKRLKNRRPSLVVFHLFVCPWSLVFPLC